MAQLAVQVILTAVMNILELIQNIAYSVTQRVMAQPALLVTQMGVINMVAMETIAYIVAPQVLVLLAAQAIQMVVTKDSCIANQWRRRTCQEARPCLAKLTSSLSGCLV